MVKIRSLVEFVETRSLVEICSLVELVETRSLVELVETMTIQEGLIGFDLGRSVPGEAGREANVIS